MENVDIQITYEKSQFFRILETISSSNIYKKNTPELGPQHKLGHIQKVLLFSQILAQNEGLDKNQTKLLLTSAAFHDCGRLKDRDNGLHGILSAKIAGDYFIQNNKNEYGIDKDEIGIIKVAIEYHVIHEKAPGQVDEIKLRELCKEYGVNNNKFEEVKQISAILKDADALDRLRFVSGSNLDTTFLRTKTAKKNEMIEFSKKINQEYAKQIINLNYPSYNYISDDKVKLLHCIRKKYKEDNNGKAKKECDIPLSIVEYIFSGNKRFNLFNNFENEFER